MHACEQDEELSMLCLVYRKWLADRKRGYPRSTGRMYCSIDT